MTPGTRGSAHIGCHATGGELDARRGALVDGPVQLVLARSQGRAHGVVEGGSGEACDLVLHARPGAAAPHRADGRSWSAHQRGPGEDPAQGAARQAAGTARLSA